MHFRDEHNEKMAKANEAISLRDKQISELKKSNQSRDSNDVTSSTTTTTSNENQSSRLEEVRWIENLYKKNWVVLFLNVHNLKLRKNADKNSCEMMGVFVFMVN